MRRLMLLVAASLALVLVVSGAARPVGAVRARWVIRDLGTLGGPQSEAVAINESVQIIGTSDTNMKNGTGYTYRRAFLWEKGRMRDLGTLGERRASP